MKPGTRPPPQEPRGRWLRAAALAVGALLALFALVTGAARAQPVAPEADVKAAYLYRFLAYVEWPPSAFADEEAPLVVGVAGDEAVRAALQTIAEGQRERGHAIQVRRLAEGDPLEGLHVLYVGRRLSPARWLTRLQDRPVLAVTDHPRGLESGGMLNFVPADGRIRFEASLARAQNAGLKLGARLLSVAERVVMP